MGTKTNLNLNPISNFNSNSLIVLIFYFPISRLCSPSPIQFPVLITSLTMLSRVANAMYLFASILISAIFDFSVKESHLPGQEELTHGITCVCIPGAVHSCSLHFRYRFCTPSPQVELHLPKAPHWNDTCILLALVPWRSLPSCLIKFADGFLITFVSDGGRFGCKRRAWFWIW